MSHFFEDAKIPVEYVRPALAGHERGLEVDSVTRAPPIRLVSFETSRQGKFREKYKLHYFDLGRRYRSSYSKSQDPRRSKITSVGRYCFEQHRVKC